MIPVTETTMNSLQADFRAHIVEVRHLSLRSVSTGRKPRRNGEQRVTPTIWLAS